MTIGRNGAFIMFNYNNIKTKAVSFCPFLEKKVVFLSFLTVILIYLNFTVYPIKSPYILTQNLWIYFSIFLVVAMVFYTIFDLGLYNGLIWSMLFIVASFPFYVLPFFSVENNFGVFLTLLFLLAIKKEFNLIAGLLLGGLVYQPVLFLSLLFWITINPGKMLFYPQTIKTKALFAVGLIFSFTSLITYYYYHHDFNISILLFNIDKMISNLDSFDKFGTSLINNIKMIPITNIELLLVNIPILTILLFIPDVYKDRDSKRYFFIGLTIFVFGMVFSIAKQNNMELIKAYFAMYVFLIISISTFMNSLDLELKGNRWYLFLILFVASLVFGRFTGAKFSPSDIFRYTHNPNMSLFARVDYVIFPFIVGLGLVYINMFKLKRCFIYLYIVVLIVWGQSYFPTISKNYLEAKQTREMLANDK